MKKKETATAMRFSESFTNGKEEEIITLHLFYFSLSFSICIWFLNLALFLERSITLSS